MSRFDHLLDGYLRDTLSETELQEFLDWVNQDPDLDLVREQHLSKARTGLTNPAQRQRMLANIQAQTHAQPPRQRRISIGRWTAAAAAILILLVSTITLLHPKNQPVAKAAPVTYKNDIAPGKTGAILQLADGSTLTLDSLSTGVIAHQGNAQVVRQANGAIAYLSNPKSSKVPEGNAAETKPAETKPAVQYNKISTSRGRQFQIVLPDGTRVWLNSSSSLTYPTAFNDHERKVEATGEVYLEVARDASRPFIVKAAQQNIDVLGTQFNVNTYEDEPIKRTTLLQGSIRVTAAGKATLLIPGEASAIDHNGSRLQVGPANVEAAVAWKNGFFQFDNADLPTVMRQLARWYGVEVRYEGRTPEYNDFKGQIGRDLTLAQVLKILEQTRVHFRIEEDKRIVIFP